MLCAGSLWADAATARTPRPARAASTPSTAQILAPSAATVPDALPPDRVIYRCGNSYSPRPCADAAVPPRDIADARSDAQRRQSDDLTSREKRLASWLEAQRREREGPRSDAKPPRTPAATGCVESPACESRRPKVRRAKVAKPPKGASVPGK
jgi:hypothetical protein